MLYSIFIRCIMCPQIKGPVFAKVNPLISEGKHQSFVKHCNRKHYSHHVDRAIHTRKLCVAVSLI